MPKRVKPMEVAKCFIEKNMDSEGVTTTPTIQCLDAAAWFLILPDFRFDSQDV